MSKIEVVGSSRNIRIGALLGCGAGPRKKHMEDIHFQEKTVSHEHCLAFVDGNLQIVRRSKLRKNQKNQLKADDARHAILQNLAEELANVGKGTEKAITKATSKQLERAKSS